MTSLKPCPFCGDEAYLVFADPEDRDHLPTRCYAVVCMSCGVNMTARYEGGNLLDSSTSEVIDAWNKRFERTCHRVPGKMVYGERRPKCSECGYGIGDARWGFCPSCGAKIMPVEVSV